MTEEQVTKAILSYLITNGWHIVCFDFPQSGTGRVLHPYLAVGEKNKGSIIPDIVAVKGTICVFFENKDRFYFPDYEKVNYLINNDDYLKDINLLLSQYQVSDIYYGIGLPANKHSVKSQQSTHLVDFIVGVSDEMSITILYSKEQIFE